MTTTEINNNFTEFLSYEPVGLTKIQYGYKVTTTYIPELRIPPSNLYTNGSFLTFDEVKIFLHSNFNTTGIKTFSVGTLQSNQRVSDVCFGNSLT